MPPAFQSFLPEGFLRERLQERFGKTLRRDDRALHALQGRAEPRAARTPEKRSLGERATLRARRLIIETGGPEWPDPTENAHHCLGIARAAGLEVPHVRLSEDLHRLSIERFDDDPERATDLGFEDWVALQGRVNAQKCEGGCEGIALAIRRNASPLQVHASRCGPSSGR
jgi:hypothetical protein